MAPLYGYNPTPYDAAFQRYGARYGIDPGILRTQASIESNFNPRAVSPAGARGIAQFMPATGAEFGLHTEEDFFDPDKNIHAQAQYMRQLIDRYPNDLDTALSAYNAGMGNVDRKGAFDWDEPTAYRKRFNERYVLPPVEERDPSLLSSGGGDRSGADAALSRLLGSDKPVGQGQAGLAFDRFMSTPSKSVGGADQAFNNLMATSELQDEAILTENPGPVRTFDVSLAAQDLDLKIGSQAFSEFVAQHGGLPSLTPSRVVEGSPYAGTEEDVFGNQVESDYPIQYKARIKEVIDADTVRVIEMGTGEERDVRFAAINTEESRGPLATPEGTAAAEDLRSKVQPGTQVTITGKGDEWRGKYGRPLGKVFINTNQRAAIDLSRPNLTGGTTTYDGVEDVGLIRAGGTAATRELVELAMMPEDLYGWINGKLNPEDEERVKSEIHQKADQLNERWTQTQADYVTGDFNPDARVWDIPLLGPVTAGELARATGSSTAYAVGISFAVGKAIKGVKAGVQAIPLIKAINALEKGEDVAGHLPAMRKLLVKTLDDADAADDVVKNLIDAKGMVREDRKQFILSMAPVKNETGMGRIRRFGKAFQANWFDRYSKPVKAARSIGKGKEMDMLVNHMRSGEDMATSPLVADTVNWVKGPDGVHVAQSTGPGMQSLWQGVDGDFVEDAMAWMAYNQSTATLIPKFNLFMGHAKGNFAEAQKIAEAAGESIVDFTPADIKFIQEAEARIENLYRGTGQFEEMVKRVDAQRDWYRRASIDTILDVGGVDQKGYDRMVKLLGDNYAPYSRADKDFLRDLMGHEFVADLDAADDAGRMIAEKAKHGKGLPSDPTPLARRKHGLGTDVSRMIEDPMPVMMRRSVAIHKWANRQRVRNLLGEAIETTTDMGMLQGVRRITDAKAVARMQRITPENGMVSFAKQADGSVERVGYLFDDPGMVIAMQSLNPASMNVLSGMLKYSSKATGLFRKMTVLGLSFIVRNPMRDQFMAAALSKYGYVPVTDWFRGLYHIATDSPVYQAYRHYGGGQSDEVSNYMGKNGENFALNLNQAGAKISDYGKILHDPDLGGMRQTGKAFLADARSEGNIAKTISARVRGSAQSYKTKRLRQESALDRNPLINLAGRVSQLFEEGTRVGAGARAVSRAKRGKRYGFLRSLDEAAGGFSGWARMLGKREQRKGFFTRLETARKISPEQQAMMRTGDGLDGIMWDADMVDEVRNITLDFARHGKYGETLNGLYPFFNAELQDMWRFGKAFKDAPLSTTTKAFTYITLPALANWYLNFDNPDYQAKGQIEKDLYLHPFGFNEEYKKFGRIPRPLGTINGVFGLSIHKMMDFLAVNDPGAVKSMEEMLWPGGSTREVRDKFQESMFDAKQGMGPAGVGTLAALTMGMSGLDEGGRPIAVEDRIDGDPLLKGLPWMDYVRDQLADYASTNSVARYAVPKKPGTAIAQIMPQILKPVASIEANYDTFFDAPIVPPRLHMAGLHPDDVYTETTSPIERYLAKGINAVTLGKLGINPIQAGYLVRAYTGSVGGMVMKWADLGAQSLGIFPERPSHVSDWTDHPGLGGLYGSEPWGSDSAPVRAMYDAWEEDSQILNSMEYAKHAQNADRLVDIMRDHPEFGPALILQDGTKQLSALHKLRRRIRSDDTMTQEERVDLLLQIDQTMTMVAYQAMNAYNAIRNDPSLMAEFATLGE